MSVVTAAFPVPVYKGWEQDVPSPYDIMHVLRQNGVRLLPHLLRMRKCALTQAGDKVGSNLLDLWTASSRPKFSSSVTVGRI